MRVPGRWVLVVLAAATVMMVAVIVTLPRGPASPLTSQSPDETQPQAAPSPPVSNPPPPSNPSPTVSASAESGTLPEWPVTPMPNPVPGAYRGGMPYDLAPGGPGFVAVGDVAPCCTGPTPDGFWQSVIWTSRDGSAWDLVADLDTFGRSGLVAVGNDDQGTLVALGYNVLITDQRQPPPFPPAHSGTVWQSVDGIDWVAVGGIEGIFRDVVWTGGEWVIGGQLDGRAAIFTSADLASWTTVPIGGPNSSVDFLTVREDGRMLAAGCIAGTNLRPCIGATWVSADGSSWEQRELEASRLTAAAAWSDGFVVAGGSLAGALAQTWASSDGLDWVAGPPQPEKNAAIETIGVSSGRLIAGGGAAPTQMTLPALWQSVDGLSWEPLAVPARLDDQTDGRVRALLPLSDRVIALGTAFVNAPAGGAGAGPYVWIGDP